MTDDRERLRPLTQLLCDGPDDGTTACPDRATMSQTDIRPEGLRAAAAAAGWAVGLPGNTDRCPRCAEPIEACAGTCGRSFVATSVALCQTHRMCAECHPAVKP